MATETGNGHDDGSAGTGGVIFQRAGAEIWWEVGDVPNETPVTVRAENAETGDVGIKLDRNDGQTFLTYPKGTSLVDHITVTVTETDEVIAAFDITVRIEN